MKRLTLFIFVVFVAGCAATQPKRVVTEDNYVTFEYPDLKLKISDDLKYKKEGHKIKTPSDGSGHKYEMWEWNTNDGHKGCFIRINTLTTGGWDWSGSPNGGWYRDIEYYKSFPKTYERGGKKWYVDVIRWKAYNKVIFGRDVSNSKRLWVAYWEKEGTYENWEDLLKRADEAIRFLP